MIWFALKPNSSLNHFEHNEWWIHTHRTTSSDDYGGVKGFPMATVVWGRDVIIQGDCGSPVNPDTQHYIITRQNTCRLYTTPKERKVVYIASPKQCSGGVLVQFLDIVSYLAGYLCDRWVPRNIETTHAIKVFHTTFIAQVIHEDYCRSQSFIPRIHLVSVKMFNLSSSIHFSESISLFLQTERNSTPANSNLFSFVNISNRYHAGVDQII